MKYIFLFLLLYTFPGKNFCQEKRTIDITAKVAQRSGGVYELIITFDADTSLYTVSMFQDTIDNILIPIRIDFKEDRYLKPVDTWVEQPKAELYDHWMLEEGRYIKKRTSYSRKFIVKTKKNFLSYFELSYWAVNERKAEPPRTVKFEIRLNNNIFKVKKLNNESPEIR